MNAGYYYTIDKSSTAEYKDRGSRFIALSFPVTDVTGFKEKLAIVKKEHPKASHHCFAYRLGLDGNLFRVSDDGEPSGSAGRPILGQIDSKQVTDISIIVVRYFGGTLLGVPGLINAYKSAAALSLQVTPIIQKPILSSYQLQFDYTVLNEVMIISKQLDCIISQKEMNLFCTLLLGIPHNRLDEALYKFNNVRGVSIEKK